MFSEGFEIVVGAGEEHWLPDDAGFDSRYLVEVNDALADLVDSPEEVTPEVTSIGRGADAIALLLLFSALTVFFQGKRVEENLEAWIRIGKRLSSVLKKLRKFGGVYVSEPAGAVIAVQQVLSKTPRLEHVALLTSELFVSDPVTIGPSFWRVFRAVPERYYLYTFQVNQADTHVICIRSTGAVEFHHVLPTGDWRRFYGIDE